MNCYTTVVADPPCAVDPNYPRSKADGEFIAALVNWFRETYTKERA
jgi:hypothetical protein